MPKASEFRYTTDGTEPTASSALYDPRSPITIALPTTLKAKGFYYPAGVGTDDGAGVGSDTSSVTYSFVVATPTLSPASGTYTAAQTVTLTTVRRSATR